MYSFLQRSVCTLFVDIFCDLLIAVFMSNLKDLFSTINVLVT